MIGKIKSMLKNANDDRRIYTILLKWSMTPLAALSILSSSVISILVNSTGFTAEISDQIISNLSLASSYLLFIGIVLVIFLGIIRLYGYIKYYDVNIEKAKKEANLLDKSDAKKVIKKEAKLEKKAQRILDRIESRNDRHKDL